MTILRAYVVKIFNGIFQALENESIDSFDKKTLDERANDCNHVENEKGQVCILGRCSFLISHNVFAIYEILLNLVTLATCLKLLLQ